MLRQLWPFLVQLVVPPNPSRRPAILPRAVRPMPEAREDRFAPAIAFSPLAKAIVASAFGGLVLFLALPEASHAGFTQDGKFIDKSLEFRVSYSWQFPTQGGQADVAGPFVGPNNKWTVVQLNSPAPPNNMTTPRNLTVTLQHSPNQGSNTPPNPVTGVLQFNDIDKGAVGTRTSATKVPHGVAAVDYFTGSVKFRGSIEVNLTGLHELGTVGALASFQNFENHPVSGSFIPSYAVGGLDPALAVAFGPLQPNRTVSRGLPNKNGAPPTDFQVQASGSGTTMTTLAFLGTAFGVPGVTELEMGPMAQLFVGFGEWLTPHLLDSSGGSLNVFVNLTQWLGSGATFNPLQTFNISGGVNDSLPGIFVSTSPISVNPDGSLQGTPFTGQVFVGGAIDGGSAVPAPSGLALAIAGLISLVPCAVYRHRRAALIPRRC